MKLGEKIKILRLEHKWTMQTLADNAGLTKGYISMLEKGENPNSKKEIIPSLETVQKIALAFNMDLETLLKDTYSNIELPKTIPTTTLSPTVQSIVDTSIQLHEKRQEKVLNYIIEQLNEQKHHKR